MLLHFSVRNFRCLAGEVSLDLTSRSLRTVVPRSGHTWTEATERVAAVYGANAAGKTTFLDALWALSQALRSPGSALLRQPHAQGADDELVEYSLDFVSQNTRYLYEVKVARWGIAFEELSSYPKAVKRSLYVREQTARDSDIRLTKGATLTGPTAEVAKITRPVALFLATAHKYQHPVLAPIARTLVADVGLSYITFRDRQDHEVLRRVLVEMVGAPSEQVDLVEALLRAADLGISGIDIRPEEVPIEVTEKLRRLLEALREGDEPLEEDAVPRLHEVVLFRHRGPDGKEFSLPVEHESAGTITWLTTAWHALNALRYGSVLLVDELDASLHPELARYLVKLFLLPQFNPHGAQLIFTTHDVSLLGNSPTRLLEPKNVWFVEKNEQGEAELFSLDDFDNRPGNNSERRYLAGQFGAIPDIDDSLLPRYISDEVSVQEGNCGE